MSHPQGFRIPISPNTRLHVPRTEETKNWQASGCTSDNVNRNDADLIREVA